MTEKRRITGIVVHQPGAGLHKRSIRMRCSMLDAAAYVYCRLGVPNKPHYCIDPSGAVLECVPVRDVARHVGRPKPWAWMEYRRGGLCDGIPDWWSDYWIARGVVSPGQLCGGAWQKPPHSVNACTIGIELLPETLRGPFSERQRAKLRQMCHELAHKWGFPVDHATVVSHSDIDPVTRSIAVKGKVVPWDPWTLGGQEWRWEGL